MRLRRAAAAMVTALLCPTVSAAQDFDTIISGNWYGGAYLSDDGTFSHCAVESEYLDGTTLAFAWVPTGLRIALSRPEWRLTEGEVYPVAASVDRRWAAPASATVVSPSAIAIDVGQDSAAINAMKRGLVLTIDAQYDQFVFQLSGTNASIQKLESCFYRNSGRGLTNPFASQPVANPFGSGTSAEFGQLREPLIGFNAFQDFILGYVSPTAIITIPDSNEELGHYNFYDRIEASSYYGLYVEYANTGYDVEAVLVEMLGAAQEACGGPSASAKDQPQSYGRGVSIHIGYSGCQEPDLNTKSTIVIMNTEATIHIFGIWADAGLAQHGDDFAGNLVQGVRDWAIGYASSP